MKVPVTKNLSLYITVLKEPATLDILSIVQSSAKDIQSYVDYAVSKRLETPACVNLAGINLVW